MSRIPHPTGTPAPPPAAAGSARRARFALRDGATRVTENLRPSAHIDAPERTWAKGSRARSSGSAKAPWRAMSHPFRLAARGQKWGSTCPLVKSTK